MDDDCDTEVDEGVTSTFSADLDGDGSGEANSTQVGCAPSAGFVANAADCDDTHSGQPDALRHCATPYTTAYGSELVGIDPGEFTMGAGVSHGTGLYRDHCVTLTHGFWIAQAEVTQSQWAAWTDTPSDPSSARGSDIPIRGALWSDAARYANALSTAEGLPLCYEDDGSTIFAAYTANPYACPGYRLPTEAEWEDAARAGQDTIYAGSDTAAVVAWTSETSDHTPHDVCSLAPNAWTLCDMNGNVWEWTNDWFDATYGGYGTAAAATDPPGPATGSPHPLRGSGWNDPQSWATTSVRNPLRPRQRALQRRRLPRGAHLPRALIGGRSRAPPAPACRLGRKSPSVRGGSGLEARCNSTPPKMSSSGCSKISGSPG